MGATSFPGTGLTRFTLEIDGRPRQVGVPDTVFTSLGSAGGSAASAPETDAKVSVAAPMSGSVLRYVVQVGDEVEAGAQVALLEAMKTEVPVFAETAGTVSEILVDAGQRVNAGEQLLRF